MRIVSKNPLFFAFAFPASVDAALTLIGQDAFYWLTQKVNEASPAYYALQFSPWLFAIGSVGWLVFWYWAMKRLKAPWNLFFVLLFIAGHSWGSATWLWKMARDNAWYSVRDQASVMVVWGGVMLYFALVALLAATNIRDFFGKKSYNPHKI